MSAPPIRLTELEVHDDPQAWRRLGFAVADDGTCVLGTTTIRLRGGGGGDGIASWTLEAPHALPPTLDGLPTRTSSGAEPGSAGWGHPNRATHLDHVVVMTPDLERTFRALEGAGFDLRRVREAGNGVRQGFYRLGEVVLEVVGDVPPDGPARFWGLVAVVPDVDALARDHPHGALGAPKDAVQPGRRIVTVPRGAGLAVPFAFLTPHPPRDAAS